MKVFNIVKYGTVGELVEDIAGVSLKGDEDWLGVLEKTNLDSAFYMDKNMGSLIESMEYNGLKIDELRKMNEAMYGNFIEFYYIEDEDVHVMEVGIR